MPQAITTKYLGATNHRPARIKATCQARSITVSWDHALDVDANHDAAAVALLEKLGWSGYWVAGGLPNGTGNCYVQSESGEGGKYETPRVTAK